MRRALIGFMKVPEAGRVKKRLAEEIGDAAALEIYERLVRRTLGVMHDYAAADPIVDLFIAHAPADGGATMRKRFPGRYGCFPQFGSHLGARMENALTEILRRGYRQAVLIGADLADLAVTDLKAAFDGLDPRTAVIGPSRDGGFYLIGTQRSLGGALGFDNWSDSRVFERVLSGLIAKDFGVRPLSARSDVDRRCDLPCVAAQPGFFSRLSIIIPFLDGAVELGPLIDRLQEEVWPGDEIILVRGGGVAGGMAGAEEPWSGKVVLLHAPRGRGIQMNAGAERARGELFWFLHADSHLPANFGYHIRKLAGRPHCALGCFRLRFAAGRTAVKLIGTWANLRTQLMGLPYGDQGLFCRRRTFERVGGFRRPYLMEDVEFVRDCKRLGKLLTIPEPIITSSRRYRRQGLLTASMRNHYTMLLYWFGVDDRTLYRRYYGRPPGT